MTELFDRQHNEPVTLQRHHHHPVPETHHLQLTTAQVCVHLNLPQKKVIMWQICHNHIIVVWHWYHCYTFSYKVEMCQHISHCQLQRLVHFYHSDTAAVANLSVPYGLILRGLDYRGAAWHPTHMSNLDREEKRGKSTSWKPVGHELRK